MDRQRCYQCNQKEKYPFPHFQAYWQIIRFAKYKAKRNQVVQILRASKHAFFNQHLNNADAKTFWKTVRFLNGNYSSIPTLLDSEGSATVKSSSAKADCLNSFFYTCFNRSFPPLTDLTQVLDPVHDSLCPSACPAEFLCSEESVLELMAGLDITKSTGTDSLCPSTCPCKLGDPGKTCPSFS